MGFTNEKMCIFLAEDLFKTKQSLDKDEFLVLRPTEMIEAVAMVWNGIITDAKSIIGILWAQKKLG